jgi:hypothetical protein
LSEAWEEETEQHKSGQLGSASSLLLSRISKPQAQPAQRVVIVSFCLPLPRGHPAQRAILNLKRA